MPGQTPLLEDFLRLDGPQMSFVATRNRLARAGEERGTTFSAEAFEAIVDQMQKWAVSRLVRAAADMDEPPRAMRVHIQLSGEGGAVGEHEYPCEVELRWHRRWPDPPGTSAAEVHTSQTMVALRDWMREWVLRQVARASGERMPQKLQITLDVRLADG